MDIHTKKIMFSSNSDEWATPNDFFDELNKEFSFTLDPCASEMNHKCVKYFTLMTNGLNQDWSNEIVFCNPPYSKVKDWIKKGAETKNSTIVFLVPVRTDTKWFHEYCYKNKNVELRFIKGRLKFINDNKTDNKISAAPFPSMLIIFRNHEV